MIEAVVRFVSPSCANLTIKADVSNVLAFKTSYPCETKKGAEDNVPMLGVGG